MMDLRSWRSSMMSSNIGRSFASSGTRKRSSRMSSWQRSIFLSSVSRLFLTFATLSSPSSLEALAYKVRMPFLQASCPRAQARKLLPVPEEPVMKRFWRVKFNREVRHHRGSLTRDFELYLTASYILLLGRTQINLVLPLIYAYICSAGRIYGPKNMCFHIFEKY